jgi:hypothetical protein
LAVVGVTGGGVGNAAAASAPAEHPNLGPGAFSIPARPGFDYLGEFANVKDAPEGTGPIGGIAAMVVTTHATTTSISVSGLDPKAVYIADVHSTSCFINEGSGPFLFDPTGPDAPPNAIWLTPIAVTKKGAGTATTSSSFAAGPRAKSVVLHLKRKAGALVDEASPPKLACADLPRVTS